MEEKWTKYPVLFLDMNTGKYDNENELANVLNQNLSAW